MMAMKAPSAVIRGQPLSMGKNMAVVRPRFAAQSRRMCARVSAVVQFDYDTKVFKKELVQFADTEEYIYRCVGSDWGLPQHFSGTLW